MITFKFSRLSSLLFVVFLATCAFIVPGFTNTSSQRNNRTDSVNSAQAVEPEKSQDPDSTATPVYSETVHIPFAANDYSPPDVRAWPEGAGVHYNPDVTTDYSFEDRHQNVSILRAPEGNTSILARFYAVDDDIESVSIATESGGFSATVSDFEVKALDVLPPGYPDGTELFRYTMMDPVTIPIVYGDIVSADFRGEDGSRTILIYEIQPSIENIIRDQIDGLGIHGAVVDLSINTSYDDFMELGTYIQEHQISVDIEQAGKTNQSDVLIEFEQGRHFVELVEALYSLGVPIDLEMHISSESRTHTARFSLTGMNQYYPFISPIYHQSDLVSKGMTDIQLDKLHISFENEVSPWYAQDHIDATDPNGHRSQGLPIYNSFGDIIIIMTYSTRIDDDPNVEYNINVYFYHEDTGFTFFATHMRPGPLLLELAGSMKDLQHFGSRWPPSTEYRIPRNNDSHFLEWGHAGPGHETGVHHLHIELQFPDPTDPDFNDFTGRNHQDIYNRETQVGICPDVTAEHPYGCGPCTQLGFYNFNTQCYLLVENEWIDRYE